MQTTTYFQVKKWIHSSNKIRTCRILPTEIVPRHTKRSSGDVSCKMWAIFNSKNFWMQRFQNNKSHPIIGVSQYRLGFRMISNYETMKHVVRKYVIHILELIFVELAGMEIVKECNFVLLLCLATSSKHKQKLNIKNNAPVGFHLWPWTLVNHQLMAPPTAAHGHTMSPRPRLKVTGFYQIV